MRHYVHMADEAPQPPQVIVAPGAVSLVYANTTMAGGTPWELSLDFGYSAGGGPFKPEVRVVMSWEQATALRGLLEGMVARYEKDFGKIREFHEEAQGGTP